MSRYVKLTTSNGILNVNNAPVALSNNIVAIDTKLSSETSRAKSAEPSLASNISTETSRAKSDETSLASIISTETIRAKSAETSLASTISTETSRAKSAESILNNSITIESNRGVTQKTNIHNSISHIISGVANIPLLDTINEIANALSREPSIMSITTTKLSIETSRAIFSEIILSNAISTHVSRFEFSDLSLNTLISNKNSSAILSEIALSSSINTEYNRALDNEIALSNTISNHVSNVTTSHSNNITPAVTRAISVETSLSTQVSITNYNNTNINTSADAIIFSSLPKFNYAYTDLSENQIGYTVSGSVSTSEAIDDAIQNSSTGLINVGYITIPGYGYWFLSGQASFYSSGHLLFSSLCIGKADSTISYINSQHINGSGTYVRDNWEGNIGFQNLELCQYPSPTSNLHLSFPVSGIVNHVKVDGSNVSTKTVYVNSQIILNTGSTATIKFDYILVKIF